MELSERLGKFKNIITNSNFLNKTGNANEVSYFIFDYPPDKDIIVEDYIQRLATEINGMEKDMQIKIFDIYGLIMDYLKDKKYIDKCILLEQKKGSAGLIKAIKDTLHLDSDGDDNYIVNHIDENTMQDKDIVFLVGVGRAFPIVRVRELLSVLNNLYTKCPIVLMLPGSYDGQHVTAFNKLKMENYYRAFKLVQ